MAGAMMIERAQSIPAMESIDPKEYLAKYVKLLILKLSLTCNSLKEWPRRKTKRWMRSN